MKTKMFALAALSALFFSCSKEAQSSEDFTPSKKDTEVAPGYFIVNHQVTGCALDGHEFDPNGFGSTNTGKTWTVSLDMNAPNGYKNTSDYVCYYRESGSTGTWYRSEPAISGFYPLVFNLTAVVGRPWTPGQLGLALEWENVNCLEFVVIHWPTMKSDGPGGTYYVDFDDLPLYLGNIGEDIDGDPFVRFEGVYYYQTPGDGQWIHPNKGEACCTF